MPFEFCRAASLPRDYCGDSVQMRLSFSPLALFLIYLIEWMDYTCTDALPNFLGLHHLLIYKVHLPNSYAMLPIVKLLISHLFSLP